jgi:protein-tyrosine-phosphatase
MRTDYIFGRKELNGTTVRIAGKAICFLNELFRSEQARQLLVIEADRLHERGSMQGELILLHQQLQSMPMPEQIRSDLYQRCFELQHTLRAQAYREWKIVDLIFEQGAIVGIHAPAIEVHRWLLDGRHSDFSEEFPWVVHWQVGSGIPFEELSTYATGAIENWLGSILHSAWGETFQSLGLLSTWLKPFLNVFANLGVQRNLRSLLVTGRLAKQALLPTIDDSNLWQQLTHLQIDWNSDYNHLRNTDNLLNARLASPKLEVIDISSTSQAICKTIVEGILQSPLPALRKLNWRGSYPIARPPVEQLCLLGEWLGKRPQCHSLIEISGSAINHGSRERYWTQAWWKASQAFSELRMELGDKEIPDFVAHAEYQTTILDLHLILTTEHHCDLLPDCRVWHRIRCLDIQTDFPMYYLLPFLELPELSHLESLHINVAHFGDRGDVQQFLECPWFSNIKELGIQIDCSETTFFEQLFSSEPPPHLQRFQLDVVEISNTERSVLSASHWFDNIVFLNLNVDSWSPRNVEVFFSSKNFRNLRTIKIDGAGQYYRILAVHPHPTFSLPSLETVDDSYEHSFDWLQSLTRSDCQRIRKLKVAGKTTLEVGLSVLRETKACSWLEELDFGGCILKEIDLIILAQCHHLENLREIYFNIDRLSEKGLRAWLGVSPYFPSLQTFRLTYQRIEAGLDELIAQIRKEWGSRISV